MEKRIERIKQKIIDTYVEYNDSLKKAEIKKEELEKLKKDLKIILSYYEQENKK
jgi:Asp-tRNA(Asn)/Glu-tRNA(Gln) amidotransferase C subunit